MRFERFSPIRSSVGLLGLFLALAEAQSPTVARAGVNTWTQLGPEGGFLCRVAVAPSDPAIVYSAGVSYFRSADGGRTWEPTGAPVERQASCFLSVDSADPLRLYDVSIDGVRRSLDGGTTWVASSVGLPQPFFPRSPVAVDAQDPDFLLVATQLEIFRSRNRGDSWQPVFRGALPGLVDPDWVGIHPTLAGTAFAVSRTSGVFTTSDYGDSWSPANDGVPDNLGAVGVEFDPVDPLRLYLQTPTGIYRSLNGGALWSLALAAAGTPSRFNLLRVRADSVVFAQRRGETGTELLTSRDGGESWQLLPRPFSSFPSMAFRDLAATPVALLAASESGISRSIDDGGAWGESNSGIFAADVRVFELDRQNPDRLYALAAPSGFHGPDILRSLDRGESWEYFSVSTAAGQPSLLDFLVDPNDSSHYLAATDYWDGSGFQGVTSSLDAGATWDVHLASAECLIVTELTLDPLQPSRLFASGINVGGLCVAECHNFSSENAGESWQCIEPDEPQDAFTRVVPSPFNAGVVLAPGYRGIYRSTNSGQDWTLVEPRPDPPGLPASCGALFIDLQWVNAETVYATNDGAGLFASHDGGLTWEATSPLGSQEFALLQDLAVDPLHPGSTYATSRADCTALPRDVVGTRDGGLSWFNLSEGLLGWELGDLALDPVTPNRLYVSADGGGILAYDLQEPEPCVPSATALCITDGRFKIESIWRDFAGHSGVGQAVQLASDTGSFWFFDADNLELFVKEIDGVSFNNAFWTFYGALSNVEFTLLATDTVTGAQHGYFNPRGRFASQGDIESFPQAETFATPANVAAGSVMALRRRAAPARSANSCEPNATTLCLSDGRFAASVTWRDFAGRTGVGTPLVLTPDTGSFWFFDAGIHELAVKVIDGRGTNNAYWVFYGSLSNVEFELTVVDTETGESWTRENPSGTFASNGDIEAFPQLP